MIGKFGMDRVYYLVSWIALVHSVHGIFRLLNSNTVRATEQVNSRRRVIRQGLAWAIVLNVANNKIRPKSAFAQDAQGGPEPEGGKNKPGPNAKKEGVERWDVKRTATGAEVDYRHQNNKYSGLIKLTSSSRSASFDLKQDKSRLQLSVSFSAGSFAGTDNKGNAFTGSFNDNSGSWVTNSKSNQIIRDSKRELSIGLAILGDLQESGVLDAPRASQARTVLGQAANCPCGVTNTQRASWQMAVLRSSACEIATNAVQNKCTNGWCYGCCRLINDCDCLCGIGDYICECGRTGVACTGECSHD